MALNEIFGGFFKIFRKFRNKDGYYKFLDLKNFFYLFLIVLFFSIFIIISHLINQKNKTEEKNLNSLIHSKEFSILGIILSKINNPYKEVKYLIQNNDSVEKSLKN